VVMFLSTACVAIISVRHNTRILAVLSLLLAGIAPLLTKPPESNYIILFSYLFIVIIGAIWIVFITGARELTMLSLVIIFAYSVPHLFSPTSFPLVQNGILLYFAYGFALLFFITNTIGILKNKDGDISLDLIIFAHVDYPSRTETMAKPCHCFLDACIYSWCISFVQENK
jgi:uncharacterized membrane protein